MLDELQLMAEEEVKAFHIYGDKFRALNPFPVKPSPVKQGWEFKAYLLVSIASVLLASMRTAEVFYRTAVFSSSSPILGYFEAVLAMFTVEAGIVVYAAVLASRSRKVSPWVLVIGILLLAAISIVAGLAQSLSLATEIDPNITQYVESALIILIGPAASVAALIGGHILGQQIAMAAKQYEELIEEYEGSVEEYYLKLKKTWERSEERKTAKKNATTRVMLQEQALLSANDDLLVKDLVAEININAPIESPQVSIDAESTQTVAASSPVVENITKVVTKTKIEPKAEAEKSIEMPMPSIPKKIETAEKMDEKVKNGNNGKRNGSAQKIDSVAIKQMQQAVIKWLLHSGKTPFDSNLNYQAIGIELGIDPQYVSKIIEHMRIAYSKRL
ncbi:MAG: hypothetical protein JEZ00_02455 [Anaerolineaceae bacterium]|nr:hypothetical protein [Anaerolineaceae bacterium]